MKSNIIIQKDKNQIIKICRNHTEFKKELYIYRKKPKFVPKLLDHNGKNTVILEYIEGNPIIDLINPDFTKLALLFVELHSLESKKGKKICLKDSNPKNFIVSSKEQKYYMLDFSEWEYDYPESDLIHFLLFWASIYPFEKFQKIFNQFKNAYRTSLPINPIAWEIFLPEIISAFDGRRRKYNKSQNPLSKDVMANRELMAEI
ncbi:MAG: hypothetical protein K8S23_01685 [Candidatus Cloacimonetes bacterium]|nr:hypothetical protein [Candidatus Cloacimonadota bacterium]